MLLSELALDEELELSDDADELDEELDEELEDAFDEELELSEDELELSEDELLFAVFAVAAACVYVDKTFCNVESLIFTLALPNSSPTIA